MKVSNPAAMHQLLALFCNPFLLPVGCFLAWAARRLSGGIASFLRLVLGRPIRLFWCRPGRFAVYLELGPPSPPAS